MANEYSFDPTGSAVGNRVLDEVYIVDGSNGRDYNFYIPRFAPFYATGFVATFTTQKGVTRNLVPGVDYHFTHRFIEASKSIGRPVYGSITFVDKETKGVLRIASYQTIGGQWTLDANQILTLLATDLSNPRSTSWGSIVSLPATFPVINHEYNLDDMVGMNELVDQLQLIEDAIRNPNSDPNDPSTDIEALRLRLRIDKVENYPVATEAIMSAGSSNGHYVTPVLVKLLLDQIATNVINTHIESTGNVHGLTAEDIGAVSAEVVNQQVLAILAFLADIQEQVDGTLRTNADHQLVQLTQDGSIGIELPNNGEARLVKTGDVFSMMLGDTFGGNNLSINFSTTSGTGEILVDGTVVAVLNPSDPLLTASIVGAELSRLVSTYFENGIAKDSAKLAGQSLTDIINTISAGVVANDAQRLGGFNLSEILAQAAAQTAANSNKLENKTLTEVLTDANATARSISAIQRSLPQDTTATSPFGWTSLFTMPSHVVDTLTSNGHYLVSVGGQLGVSRNAMFSITCDTNNLSGGSGIINVVKITDEPTTGVEFGYTDDGTVVTVYVKQPMPRTRVSVTQLNKNSGSTTAPVFNPLEPASITYVTVKTVGSNYDAQITALTNRVATLEADLLTLTQTVNDALLSAGG